MQHLDYIMLADGRTATISSMREDGSARAWVQGNGGKLSTLTVDELAAATMLHRATWSGDERDEPEYARDR